MCRMFVRKGPEVPTTYFRESHVLRDGTNTTLASIIFWRNQPI